jgi:hypothetical protein
LTLIAATGCHPRPRDPVASQARDINQVLREHDDGLLAIPGVVGVFVGLLDDGKTPCLKLMVTRLTPELKRSIPRELEGYAVIPEVTGEIRPMEKR